MISAPSNENLVCEHWPEIVGGRPATPLSIPGRPNAATPTPPALPAMSNFVSKSMIALLVLCAVNGAVLLLLGLLEWRHNAAP